MTENLPAIPDATEVERLDLSWVGRAIEWASTASDPAEVNYRRVQVDAYEAALSKMKPNLAPEVRRAQRWLEARLGALLPAEDGGRGKLSIASDSFLSRNQARQFRMMAARMDDPEVVAAIEAGESRRGVMRAVEGEPTAPPPTEPDDTDEKPAEVEPPSASGGVADLAAATSRVYGHYEHIVPTADELEQFAKIAKRLTEWVQGHKPKPEPAPKVVKPAVKTRHPKPDVHRHSWSSAEHGRGTFVRHCKTCGQTQEKVRGQWVDR